MAMVQTASWAYKSLHFIPLQDLGAVRGEGVIYSRVGLYFEFYSTSTSKNTRKGLAEIGVIEKVLTDYRSLRFVIMSYHISILFYVPPIT